MGEVTIAVYHNVAKDESGRSLGFDGYRHGHSVVKVFECRLSYEGIDPSLLALAERVFAFANGHPNEGDEELMDQYYGRKLRSLSVGDLVQVTRALLVCARMGFDILEAMPHEINDITSDHESEHGTQPWDGPFLPY